MGMTIYSPIYRQEYADIFFTFLPSLISVVLFREAFDGRITGIGVSCGRRGHESDLRKKRRVCWAVRAHAPPSTAFTSRWVIRRIGQFISITTTLDKLRRHEH
jgi:hypothetical protein